MIFNQANKRAARLGRRLFSVPVWIEQRAFTGNFDLAGLSYKIAFLPARAEIINKQMELRGRLTVTDPRGRARSVETVRASFAGIQGGIGAPPVRRQVTPPGAQTGNLTTSQQKQQAAGENEKRAGQKTEEQSGTMPRTESTGPTSFCGVMYLHLEPLNARALNVGADLSRVQLNARFAPKDGEAKTLHSLYTALVDALYGEQVSEAEAATIVEDLNKALRG
jgi:hypothetical protein